MQLVISHLYYGFLIDSRLVKLFSWIFRSTSAKALSAEYPSYEGCSNMNASSFITFVKYMLRQHGIRFYKGLYVTYKLAPALKKNTIYLSSYSSLNEGHFIMLTNSMLRTYQFGCWLVLLLYVPSQQLWSLRDGQFT